jgi:hypothetical protein
MFTEHCMEPGGVTTPFALSCGRRRRGREQGGCDIDENTADGGTADDGTVHDDTAGAERWPALFADLEAQFDASEQQASASDLIDRIRYEIGQLSLLDRLRGAVGDEIHLGVRGSDPLRGVVRDVGPDWVLLGGGGDGTRFEVVVAGSAISWADGLRGGLASSGPAWAAPDLRRLLRACVQSRCAVTLVTRDGHRWHGTVGGVYADHVELALHDPAQRPEPGRRRALPIADLAVLIREV